MSDLKGPQPSPVPEPDRHQIDRLNSLYKIIDAAPEEGGLKARLAFRARRLFARVLSRQQDFNAVVVDHINRTTLLAAEAHRASVDTIEWIGLAVNRCEAATDEVRRHTEAFLARDRRNEAAVAALASQQDELRTAVSVLQQAAQNLKRAIATAPAGSATPNAQRPTPKENTNQFDDLDSHKYVGFEDQFRGSPEDIRRRVTEYLPLFQGPGPRAQTLGLRARGSAMCLMSAAGAASSSSCSASMASAPAAST